MEIRKKESEINTNHFKSLESFESVFTRLFLSANFYNIIKLCACASVFVRMYGERCAVFYIWVQMDVVYITVCIKYFFSYHFNRVEKHTYTHTDGRAHRYCSSNVIESFRNAHLLSCCRQYHCAFGIASLAANHCSALLSLLRSLHVPLLKTTLFWTWPDELAWMA